LACRIPRSRKRAIGCGRRCRTRASSFPSKRITVNLAPADLPKESGRFDLPIALGILAASGQIPAAALADHEFAGELSLSGELRPIRGALAMVLAAGSSGDAASFCRPAVRARRAGQPGAGAGRQYLLEVCAHLTGQGVLAECLPRGRQPPIGSDYPDLG
jgi:magnesium chelatase family protein